ncbi:hypothetical protein GOBAR_AA37838 [Gossypium barbadense]|uniref:Xylanase inhibitor C-terminal domain-containing protein n=1 Tax=Gossypium barbadense TaxID=3634 RepID=A0A2P5VVL7_GOSBA|nr:hypothetical protein GOBAR_AA37838 [Gossypium barbadense]
MASLQYLLFTSFLLFFVAPGLAQQSFRPRPWWFQSLKTPPHFNTSPFLTKGHHLFLYALWLISVDDTCGLIVNGIMFHRLTIPPGAVQPNARRLEPMSAEIVSMDQGQGATTIHLLSNPATPSLTPPVLVRLHKMLSLCNELMGGILAEWKFSICLSSANGVIFFGDGPYVFLPGVDALESLTFTPLFINPISTAPSFPLGEPSAEYFIGVKSIKVNEKPVSLNTTLLSINSEGVGGTKISIVNPYTTLEASIFKAVTEAFINKAAARNITRVAGVAPFEVCFSSRNIVGTRLGAAVPSIDLVLQNENTFWRIFGANSMVKVSREVTCLGFVNGGSNPQTSIVIGGYQLEDTFLQFDLATSRLGFSSTLLGRQTTCANFNFTSNA